MQKDTRCLLWNTAALLFSYMAVAMPLPVISVFVTRHLGLSNGLSGLAVGIAFLTTILSRGFSGRFADRNGGKACMMRGLLLYAAASAICLVAGATGDPAWAFALLIAGRLVLGLGESMAIVGMLSWNIALLGPQRSGTVFSLVGASLYGAFALGGPLGLLCFGQFGFTGLMLLCSPLPLLGWLMVCRMPAVVPASARPGVSFLRVLGSIWRQGAIVGFQGVGFAAIGAFISLYFTSRGWQHAGLALTCFGIGFVLVRLFFGHLPDRLGGMRVAAVSLGVAAGGQLALWLAPSAEIALTGAFLTGTGCSLVYPSMGVEVIRKVQPELRGTAVGGFAIFQDVAYGATAPIAGLFADHFGYAVVFMIGLAAALVGLLIAIVTAVQKTAVTH
ncbi:MFS transporter [Desulfovibrio falkowii]|uniref:MFS transporter n=1 Tax=Desulfovibrio sp. WGS1351 TaxID=3366814 RepID=UPI0025FC81A9|nr:MFS transporter [uncultured Desulfovibrio sp.]